MTKFKKTGEKKSHELTDVDDFRRRAEEARQQAERCTKDTDKATWLKVAEEWLRLAAAADEFRKR